MSCFEKPDSAVVSIATSQLCKTLIQYWALATVCVEFSHCVHMGFLQVVQFPPTPQKHVGMAMLCVLAMHLCVPRVYARVYAPLAYAKSCT